MDFKDAVNVPCRDLPCRGSRTYRGIGEWYYAETAAFERFQSNFLQRHRGGLVINQDNYKREGSQDRGIDYVLRALREYFRNWWSRQNPSREGGSRKPDGLGISPNGRVIEIIEVKPANRYLEAVDQLNEMIEKIKDGLQASNEERYMGCPVHVDVKGSIWKPEGRYLVERLPDVAGADEEAWICFKPTLTLPDGSVPVNGVILYEIHALKKA